MTGQQAEHIHHNRKEERRDAQQNCGDHSTAHDVAVETDRQRYPAREFRDDVEGEHDEGRLQIGLEVSTKAPAGDAKQRAPQSEQTAPALSLSTGMLSAARTPERPASRFDTATNKNSVPAKYKRWRSTGPGDFLDLGLNALHDHFKRRPPTVWRHIRAQFAGDQHRRQWSAAP